MIIYRRLHCLWEYLIVPMFTKIHLSICISIITNMYKLSPHHNLLNRYGLHLNVVHSDITCTILTARRLYVSCRNCMVVPRWYWGLCPDQPIATAQQLFRHHRRFISKRLTMFFNSGTAMKLTNSTNIIRWYWWVKDGIFTLYYNHHRVLGSLIWA